MNLKHSQIIKAGYEALLQSHNPNVESFLAEDQHKIISPEEKKPILLPIDNAQDSWSICFFVCDRFYFLNTILRYEKGCYTIDEVYILGRCWPSLVIRSPSLTPEDITDQLGVTPTTTGLSGEQVRPGIKSTYDKNLWEFSIPFCPGFPEDGMLKIMQQFIEKESLFQQLRNEVDITIAIRFEGFRDWWEGLHLNHKTIQFLAKISAEIDVAIKLEGPPSEEVI